MRPEELAQLARRQDVVDVPQAVHVQFAAGLLVLLGGAGHDGHRDDVFRKEPHALRPGALDDGPQHLLRRLAARKVRQKVRVVLLEEQDPGGTAGGELRQRSLHVRVALRVDAQRPAEALDELRALLQDAEVGREVGVR